MLSKSEELIPVPAHGQKTEFIAHKCSGCNGDHWCAKADLREETIVDEAKRLVFGDRRDAYHHPLDDYTATAHMFNAAFAHKLKEPLTAEEMMLTQVIVKVSRLSRNMTHRDSLVDIPGYALCIEESFKERERRET